MRIVSLTLGILTLASVAQAQETSQRPFRARDEIAIGGLLTPAVDGFNNFWFMPAVRLSAPIGARVGIDFDAGRIIGGTSEFSPPLPDSTSRMVADYFYAGQLRFLTSRRRSNGNSNYWILGVNYIGTRRFDSAGNLVSREPAGGGVLGFGSDQLFANGARLSAEFGISGPDGFRPFLAIGVHWRPFR